MLPRLNGRAVPRRARLRIKAAPQARAVLAGIASAVGQSRSASFARLTVSLYGAEPDAYARSTSRWLRPSATASAEEEYTPYVLRMDSRSVAISPPRRLTVSFDHPTSQLRSPASRAESPPPRGTLRLGPISVFTFRRDGCCTIGRSGCSPASETGVLHAPKRVFTMSAARMFREDRPKHAPTTVGALDDVGGFSSPLLHGLAYYEDPVTISATSFRLTSMPSPSSPYTGSPTVS